VWRLLRGAVSGLELFVMSEVPMYVVSYERGTPETLGGGVTIILEDEVVGRPRAAVGGRVP